jgi:hypothetical protein
LGVPAVAFIAGIMKSLASQETEAKKAGMRPKLVDGFDEQVRPEWDNPGVSPEHAALSRIEDGAVLAEIEKLIPTTNNSSSSSRGCAMDCEARTWRTCLALTPRASPQPGRCYSVA